MTNSPIAERLGVDERWISDRTGVLERRIAEPEVSLVDLATDAARNALADCGITPGSIDLVVLATMTHEMLCPAGAPLIASRLGAGQAGAYDLNSACNGFLSGISVAAGQIESGRADAVLVVGADLMSRVIDHDDRSTAGIFGDGAGAIVIADRDGRGRIGPVVLGADGARGDLIEASRTEAILRMKGHDTFRQAVDRLSEVTVEAIRRAGLDPGEIDLFAYHQANSRILTAVGERLGVSAERVIDVVPRYANTSAATIPIALAEARADDRLKEGDLVLVAGFGGGLSWGATVIEWGHDQSR